jgi:hypothetical protein
MLDSHFLASFQIEKMSREEDILCGAVTFHGSGIGVVRLRRAASRPN